MLPRSKRLSVPLFTNVLTNGKIVHTPLFTARILKTASQKAEGTRFSAVISKKIAKTAVLRSTLRRRIYSAVHTIDSKIKDGYQVILMAKQPLIKSLLKDIVIDLNTLFVKNDLIK